jgi:hypothetical protein
MTSEFGETFVLERTIAGVRESSNFVRILFLMNSRKMQKGFTLRLIIKISNGEENMAEY